MKEVDNFNLLESLISWEPGEKTYWISIAQRDKDWHLRTEKEQWEVKSCWENEDPEKRSWTNTVHVMSVQSKQELEYNRDRIKTVCKALGARAYISPNPTYSTETLTAVVVNGLFDIKKIPGKVGDIKPDIPFRIEGTKIWYQGGFKPYSRDWWYEIDVDSPTGGGNEHYLEHKEEGVEFLRKICTIREVKDIPSYSGIHTIFQIEDKKFPQRKWKNRFPHEMMIHVYPQLVLYAPRNRYYLSEKRPPV